MNPIRALGLMSGGLDSAIAAKLLIEQGLDVVGLHLESPTACRSDVRALAEELGIRLEIRAKGESYLELLRDPRWGYGRNMNPCIDCRVFMFGMARPVLEELGAAFVFTGEVVGQRPMSQGRDTLARIDREAGLEGLVLRPLSARVLPETLPEQRGWVDRSRLLGIHGRGRVEQLELAGRYGLRNVASPAGGCLLTDARFSVKLRDLFDHTARDQTTTDDVALLRLGRHFRIHASLKVVLGRSRDENVRLKAFEGDGRWWVEPVDFGGPVALVCGARNESSLEESVRLMARYTRNPEPSHLVRWRDGDTFQTRPLGRAAEAPIAVPSGASATP